MFTLAIEAETCRCLERMVLILLDRLIINLPFTLLTDNKKLIFEKIKLKKKLSPKKQISLYLARITRKITNADRRAYRNSLKPHSMVESFYERNIC